MGKQSEILDRLGGLPTGHCDASGGWHDDALAAYILGEGVSNENMRRLLPPEREGWQQLVSREYLEREG